MLFILRILCHFAGVLLTGLFVATGVNYRSAKYTRFNHTGLTQSEQNKEVEYVV